MKKSATLFLQGVIVLIGIVTLTLMIWLPLTEGRAVGLDLFHIYADPLILYGHATSSIFFIALYQAFILLGHIGQNKVFSPDSVKALRIIKYCAMTLGVAIAMAGLYIRIFHAKDDDPAGFLAMAILTTFTSVVIATAAAIAERLLQNAVDIKSENDLTV